MPDSAKSINAAPTKDFFIYMLTRDVPLSRSILDLIDNSVDGARRLRSDGDYDGLYVSLEISRDSFLIEDNCGGIAVAVARDYAFRFGRPPSAANTPHSIGEFGVGMKRTFFKVGNSISVKSTTESSSFTINVDVPIWLSKLDKEQKEDWTFEFDKLDENVQYDPGITGTSIEIHDLHDNVSETFATEAFLSRLEDEISEAHAGNVARGLQISLNGKTIEYIPITLKASEDLQPAHVKKVLSVRTASKGVDSRVSLALYAGVSERSKGDGGWYIYCNGRNILRADQSIITGWGEGRRVPRYHPNFAFFRGYVFFDAESSGVLPWTTTKTGVDYDHPVFRATREIMIEYMKPIIGFLKELDVERAENEAGEIDDKELAEVLESASNIAIEEIHKESIFLAPERDKRTSRITMQRIQYFREKQLVEKVKSHIEAASFKDVGEYTFDYFVELELEEE